EYMRFMIEDHRKEIEKFNRQQEKAEEPEVRKFASKNLPILKKHLELARQTGRQVGVEVQEKR
ncbi:MAG: DUF4142 domain-containing protein, partial [Candidatus Binatia bacterium]